MRLRRKALLLLAALGALAAAWGLVRWLTLPGWLARELARQLPFPFQVDQVEAVRPLSVRFHGLRVPHPSGGNRPEILTLRALTLTVPWWGLWVRPVPVAIEMDSPDLILDVEYGDALLRQVNFLPMGSKLLSIRLAPTGLKIRNGRMEVADRQVHSDRPLYTVGHFELALGMTSPWEYPSIRLSAKGDFLTPENKRVGWLSAEVGAATTLQRMHGKLEIWYGQLEDFRAIYYDAPQPLTFEGGAGGPVIEWRFEGDRLWISMRCLTEGLKIGGSIGGVPWQTVLDSLADPAGKIDLTVATEGSLKDPGFDPHNRLLSELDWAMKERAAAKGVRIPGWIFYGLVRPEAGEEAAQGEPVEP